MDLHLFIALFSSSCLATIGQVLLKVGADRVSAWYGWFNFPVIVGLGFYGAGVVLWLYGLSRAPLCVVYPFAIVTFVLAGIFGASYSASDRMGGGLRLGDHYCTDPSILDHLMTYYLSLFNLSLFIGLTLAGPSGRAGPGRQLRPCRASAPRRQ